MSDCKHMYKTGSENTLICQDCGEVFTPDPVVVKHLKQRPKKPLPKSVISYWYLVPVMIKYHYHSDGQESFTDTVLDIPMTEPFISDLKEAENERSVAQEKILEESLDALLEKVTAQLHETLPPALQQDCTHLAISPPAPSQNRVSKTPSQIPQATRVLGPLAKNVALGCSSGTTPLSLRTVFRRSV